MLAGGQSLGPLLNLRLATPGLLVDVNRLPLASVQERDGMLELGALVRQRDAERSEAVARAAPLLAEALPWIGHAAIRNRGTVGGSLAHGDPAAELPAVAVALEAEIVARSRRGERRIAAADLFELPLVTALASDELLVSLRVPPLPAAAGWAWVELARRHGDFALAGVAAIVRPDGGGRLVLAGVGPRPLDVSALLDAAAEPREVAGAAAQACDPPSDVHGSAPYRRRLVRALVRRALETARARAA